MAHISMIDLPTDTYGEVASLAKPLVDRMNHASMSRTTYVTLSTLLAWAIARMEQVEKDLVQHEVHTGRVSAPVEFVPETIEPVVPENTATETLTDASSHAGEGNDLGEGANQATGSEKRNSNEQAPLPAITAAEEAEDAAQAAEIAQAEAEVAAKAVEAAPVAEEAPKATKRIAKPV